MGLWSDVNIVVVGGYQLHMLVLENTVMSDYRCVKSRRRPNVIKDEYVTEEQGEGI